MRDALQVILNGVRIIVQRVDTPFITLAVVRNVLDAVNGRVPHIHVGAGKVYFGAQRLFAVCKLARAHAPEQIQVFLRGAVPVGRRPGGHTGIVAAVGLHLLARQIVHICLAFQNQFFGIFITFVKVVTAIKDAAVRVRAQPLQVFPDAVHILYILAGGVRVVIAQVEFAAIRLRDAPVDPDSFHAANVQVAIRFRREARVNLFHYAAGKVFIDDLGDKIAGLFHCVLSPPHKVPARRAGLGSICFDYSVKPPVVQAKTVLRAQKAVRFAP